MIEDANAERIIKLRYQREFANISLHHMNIVETTRCLKRGFDRVAQVNTNNVLHFPFSSQLQMSSLAATAIEHNLVLKKLRFDRIQPTEKLLSVLPIVLVELLPFPPKSGSNRGFLFVNLGQVCKSRNSAHNRIHALARGTR